MRRRLYIIVPNFPPGAHAAARADNFRVWFLKNRSVLRNLHDLEVMEIELRAEGVHVLGSGATIQFSPPTLPIPRLRAGRALEPRGTPKGLALRLGLQIVLDEVDREGIDLRDTTYVVQIDASGAFDFDCIYVILDSLLDEERKLDLFVGRRPGEDRLMGSVDRVKVELFEGYLVETVLTGRSVDDLSPAYPDTQAGCWGLRCSALERLSLTASAYELEFDLFCSAIMMRVAFDVSAELIAGTRIGQSGVSKFLPSGEKDHSVEVKKLPFIAHKLGLKHAALLKALEHYLALDGDLPPAYVAQVRQEFKAG